MRESGTERPHSSKFNAEWREGSYHCKGCNKALFDSPSKFDAGCGWPSFDREALKQTSPKSSIALTAWFELKCVVQV